MKLTDTQIARLAALVDEHRPTQAELREASSFEEIVAARRVRVGRPRG